MNNDVRNNRPNILFINVDQQRYDCLGFNGHPLVKTPNIDRIAFGGMCFTNAFTPIPLCCSSRQTLFCGVMPEVHGGLWNYDNGNHIPWLSSSRHCWIRDLKAAGYNTTFVGKWHISPVEDATKFGYDRHLMNSHGEVTYGQIRTLHPVVGEDTRNFLGKYEDVPYEQAHTHVLAGEAICQIEDLSSQSAPWHLRLDFPQPHLPCHPAMPFASMYNPADIQQWGNFPDPLTDKPYIQKEQFKNWCLEDWTWDDWSIYMSGYLGVISQIDDAIGTVLDYLEDHQLMENTLILFTTDHGDMAGSHGMMDKHYVLYEEVVHVPLIMRWDAGIPAGSSCDDFISHYLDLGPTFLDLLGLPIPKEYQGLSFAPQMRGEGNPERRDFIFATYHGQQFGLYSQRMFRDNQYKYIWNATDVDELYDLHNDPDELTNLAWMPDYEELLQSIRIRLWDQFNILGDRLLQNGRLKKRFYEGI
jgi:arylsulfatase A-like enzyme